MADAGRDLIGEGRWLMDHRQVVDAGECEWLLALAAFDAAQGWAVDGMRSCVDWLRWRTRLGRSTCYEKVWIAAQLLARPQLADRFGTGTISYSAVRLLCRLDDPHPDVEAALLDLAEKGTVRDLEHACAHYQQLADQEKPPPDPHLRRGVRVRPLGEGWARVEITMPALEAEELGVTLDAFMAAAKRTQHRDPGGPSAHADDHQRHADSADTPDVSAHTDDPNRDNPGDDLADEVEPSAQTDDEDPGDDPAETLEVSAQAEDDDGDPVGEDAVARWRVNRGVAFTEIVRCALAHLDDTGATADDRYMVHVVARNGELTLIDGTPIPSAAGTEITCDASIVAHTVDEHGEPLHLGRRSRTWTTAQRRAATVRDSGTCRFIGCDHRARHLHHQIYWSAGGTTDISNAVSLCHFHHQTLHHGFTTTPTPDGGLAFHRPDGTHLGTTYPAQARLDLHDEAA